MVSLSGVKRGMERLNLLMVGGFGIGDFIVILSQEFHEVFFWVQMFCDVPLEGFIDFRLIIGSWSPR